MRYVASLDGDVYLENENVMGRKLCKIFDVPFNYEIKLRAAYTRIFFQPVYSPASLQEAGFLV